MKTETLYEFIAISRLKSFNAAAKELFLARSALSAHISALESELGFPLFDRAGEAELTMEGSIFLAYVEPMLQSLETVVAQCAERASSAPANNESALRVSYAGADASMLAMVRELSPTPIVLLPYNPSKPFIGNIEDNDPDVVFFFDVRASEKYSADIASLGFVAQPTGLHPCSLVVSIANPLAKKDTHPSSRDLESCKILLSAQPEFSYLQEAVESMLHHPAGLSFGLLPDWTDESLQNLDLGSDVLLSMSPRMTKLFEGDPRVRIIHELDGAPFGFEQIALMRQKPRNKDVAAFYRALANAVADGTWPEALSKQA